MRGQEMRRQAAQKVSNDTGEPDQKSQSLVRLQPRGMRPGGSPPRYADRARQQVQCRLATKVGGDDYRRDGPVRQHHGAILRYA
jgi:hypothetical protein